MLKEALNKTLKTKKATFWSTSRDKLWTKEETSGDYLRIDKIFVDCDQDAIVYQVTLLGDGICHTYNMNGEHRKACFYREINMEENDLPFINFMK